MQEFRSRWVPQPSGPPWLREWLKRHQHPVSFVLHLIGIPLTMLALGPLLWDLFSFEMWCWAALLFLSGYALQFVGHAIEGNDAGELILVKKWLGMPYIAISPRSSATTSHT